MCKCENVRMDKCANARMCKYENYHILLLRFISTNDFKVTKH